MKIGWWAEVSITPDTFVFGTPNNHVPLIREAERRGHTVELIHVPWKIGGEYVLEKPDWQHLRPAQVMEDAVARRESLNKIVAQNSGLDATMRTFAAARKELDAEESDSSLDHDVIFMKLPPPGFLRTKLEVVYNMWRFAQAGVPVFVFDGDLMWDQAVPWLYEVGHTGTGTWDRVNIAGYLHARTAYQPKRILPNWKFQPYWYDAHDELPLQTPHLEMWPKAHALGYVGNDWKQEGSPRAAGLGKFYGHFPDRNAVAVWGRWTPENRALSGVPDHAFNGPINAAHVRLMYQRCKASVVLGLPAYYKVGLVTQRYREIIQAGCLALIDSAYEKSVTDMYVQPQYRVDSAADVEAWLSYTYNTATYTDLLFAQRDYVKNQPALRLESWIDQLEALAKHEVKT